LARLLEDRVPDARLVLERDVAERDDVERAAVDREPPERAALERVPDARDAVERVPDARDAVERLVLREPLRAVPELARDLLAVERDAEVLVCVRAWRSLSKSLSACLLVLAASRRSARIAAVTSL
jgi:hypothetical protein